MDATVLHTDPAGIYLLKVNKRNTRIRCEICSKLTIKTIKIPERCQWRRSGIFIINFEHISHVVLVFLLLTLNMQLQAGEVVARRYSVKKIIVSPYLSIFSPNAGTATL